MSDNKRKYILMSDSTCDLPPELYSQLGVTILKLSFEIDGQSHSDGDMDYHEFYDKMRNGSLTKTSQISPAQAEAAFEKQIKNGLDILYLSFSSGLSGTFNSTSMARDNLLEKYPDARIVCIDSLCASTGEGLLLYKAWEKMCEGYDIDELARWIEENKLHVCHLFTVDDLVYLQRGGRISKVTAVAGAILGIKPILHVDDEGRLVAIGKVRGRKQSLNKIIDLMCERIEGYENPIIGISHGDCWGDADYIAELARRKLGQETKVITSYVGTVIGAHSGPGTLAFFFMGDKR
ncbi:MAG: DegV family protein [Ruminococcus sp.]|nr:DegV family protein [Ruminococcus sp.]